MRKLIAALLLAAAPARAAYFSHPALTPSGIQGEVFVGTMHTNSGYVEENIAPIFYRNAGPTDPWYKPSFAPLVVGWNAGAGNASGGLGSILDVGPQFIAGAEGLVGIFSAKGKADMVTFFTCSPTATYCGTISAGVLLNGTFESGGQITRTWKEFGAHPVGEFFGPSVWFGGKPLASVN